MFDLSLLFKFDSPIHPFLKYVHSTNVDKNKKLCEKVDKVKYVLDSVE